MWVDLNHDGVFGTDERLVYGSSSSSGTLSATMTIPATALLGQTRMRVTMKYNSAATACETFSYGEVEDYTLNIVSSTYNVLASSFEAAEALSTDELHDFMVFPNPVQNDLNIFFAGMREVILTIYDVSGRVVRAEPLFSQDETLDVSGLAKGIYTLILDDGNKQISTRFIKQ